MHELLTPAEMAEADKRAAAAGVASLKLMDNAGKAVADAAARMVSATSRICVLAGPGNNGGDGFAAALHLRNRGYDVRMHLLGDRQALKGAAAASDGAKLTTRAPSWFPARRSRAARPVSARSRRCGRVRGW